MAEGQKARRIGSGMKPRGNKRVKSQKEENSMTEQSTVEGHGAPLKDAVSEGQEGDKTPPSAEAENEPNLLQNLENSEAMVAHNEDLEAAMNESAGEVIDAEFNEVDESPEMEQVLGEPAGTDLATAMAVGTGTVKDLRPPCGGEPMGKRPTIAELETALEEGRRVELKTNGEVEIGPRIGLQPDGSYGVVATIQEGYWEAVQQWAEADDVPVERWLSDRLYEYISTYGAPAKGR